MAGWSFRAQMMKRGPRLLLCCRPAGQSAGGSARWRTSTSSAPSSWPTPVTFRTRRRVGGGTSGSRSASLPPAVPCHSSSSFSSSPSQRVPPTPAPCPREAPLRSSSSPPNSTGSTVDSDVWDPQRLTADFRSPAVPAPAPPSSFVLGSDARRPRKHLLLEHRLEKVKKKKVWKGVDGAGLSRTGWTCSSLPEFSVSRTIKEEPSDDLPVPLPVPSRDHVHTSVDAEGLVVCKQESDSSGEGRGWCSEPRGERHEGGAGLVKEEEEEDEEEEEEEFPGTRTVFRQGKQVVFRDEDGSADDEDIMVDSDDDSWDLVTCFCMKPFAGRAMIECNECSTWIHLSCAKIRKSNVPETYVCQRCKDSKFDIRRSRRSRLSPRQHVLD
uniref:PHD finger protein 13 n=1 Tax=Denticeps clupeoides TaxID=299321 RepID=A0AAY4DUS7_9TELE